MPLTRAPASIGTGLRFSSMPMRREKNSSTSRGVPNSKNPAFSRKNGRFSGKNRSNRVRLICSSSTSTCAKSVLNVASSVRLGVSPYLTSRPASRSIVVRSRFVKILREPAHHVGQQLQVAIPLCRQTVQGACERDLCELERPGDGRPNDCSLLLRSVRKMFSPQVRSSPGGNAMYRTG